MDNYCEYAEGCNNDIPRRMFCWLCGGTYCALHSNRIPIECFTNRGGWAMRRRRICDDCLNGEERP